MDDYLTLAEIEARYAPDWVLIDEPKTDEVQHLLGGRIVDFGSDRGALFQKAKDLGLHHVAVRKLGPLFEEGAFWFTPSWMIESYFATDSTMSVMMTSKENERG